MKKGFSEQKNENACKQLLKDIREMTVKIE